MGTSKEYGFTIIETMLFLSITSVLIVGMIVGASVSLNTQRYRDATQTFKGLLQEQYSDVANTQNGRQGAWNCNAAATVTTGGSDVKGQSDCILVGKYMRIDRSEISIYPVLAYQTGTLTLNDVESLKRNYALNASVTDVEERTLEWGTEIAWPTTGSGARTPTTPRTFSALFIRSPDSGLVYTFTGTDIPDKTLIAQDTFTTLLVSGASIPGQGGRTICLASNGLKTTGDMAITIKSYAASSAAIETVSNDLPGRTTKC